jgi:UDP-N-acetylglucosamine transferase subunit ALG13
LIFVVTGIHEHGFNRLVKAVDDMAGHKLIHDVFMQTGFSTYVPQNCRWLKAMDFVEFEKNMNEADIIISHGGAGCIAGALERGKPTIVVPRLKKYGEHNNDHQLELTAILEQTGRILAVYDIKDLTQAVKKAVNFTPQAATGNSHITEIIRDFLNTTAREKKAYT